MKEWYGLKINGELQYVLKWHQVPVFEDFGLMFQIGYQTTCQYEIVPVAIVTGD